MMMPGPLLTWMQKLAAQQFTLDVYNLFTKATTFTPVFRLLLVMQTLFLSSLPASIGRNLFGFLLSNPRNILKFCFQLEETTSI